jgi:hypothetical protein
MTHDIEERMSKSRPNATERKMEYVEITQVEEMPALSDVEKAELIQSLKKAEDRIAAGDGITFKPGEFSQWLRQDMKALRAGRKRAV